MRYETWARRFQPVANHLTANTAIDGRVFLPHGTDLEFVRNQPRETVWSFVVYDGPRQSVWLISEGFHIVNLMGYLVTRKSFDASRGYQVRY